MHCGEFYFRVLLENGQITYHKEKQASAEKDKVVYYYKNLFQFDLLQHQIKKEPSKFLKGHSSSIHEKENQQAVTNWSLFTIISHLFPLFKYNKAAEIVWLKSEESPLISRKYHARAVKGGDLRSSAYGAWVRIPLVLFLSDSHPQITRPLTTPNRLFLRCLGSLQNG